MARVTVLGLDMDRNTYAAIVAALRDLYPELTTGKSDELAAQSVLKFILLQHLSTSTGRRSGPDPTSAAREAAELASKKRKDAEESSWRSADVDIRPTAI